MSKIKDLEQLVRIRLKKRKEGKKVVAYSGSFDLVHSGHILSLKEAKKQGDCLVVLLNSDKSVKHYKGPHRPINNQSDRAAILEAMESVDYIMLFDDLVPNNVLEKIRPDIYCVGSDWGKDCVERAIIEKTGGAIYKLSWQDGASSSNMIEKIIKSYSTPDSKAVFLDRDGVINVNEPPYVHKKEDFKFTKNAVSALKKLSETYYKIIVVSNQSGIGRGYYPESDTISLHEWMVSELKKENVRIDHIYYCPHGPGDNCNCRKPKIGMLLKAVEDYGISLNKSWMIGDDQRDVTMSRNANLKSIKIGDKMPADLKLEPNHYAKDLFEAVNIILKQT